ncbi:hypothetical protein PAHAL_3G267000 [Panicum hallii]|jgi:hypothetical protein|uniref:Uncharacterized protein n=1 Tax=Panicum hallii TaxID=206008 RepID=A0A2T8KJN6_9POAL|nr:hypothetical protein PAHAL_3G267000 [Panicum hallii]
MHGCRISKLSTSVVYNMVVELTVLEAEHFTEHLAGSGGYSSFNVGKGAVLHRAGPVS